jgi:hypothetical protein
MEMIAESGVPGLKIAKLQKVRLKADPPVS